MHRTTPIVIIAVCLAVVLSTSWSSGGKSVDLTAGTVLWQYIGQVNNIPDSPVSNQFGMVTKVRGMEPSTELGFFTEAKTTKVTSNGPLKVIERTGTTTLYLPKSHLDFSSSDSFRSGTPVQVSSLQQLVVVDTATGTFSVINENTVTSAAPFNTGSMQISLGSHGQVFKSRLTGQMNSPGGGPSGWFAGYAEGVRR